MIWWLSFRARRGDPAAIRELWRRWRTGGDPAIWEVLRRTGLIDDELVLSVLQGIPAVRATALETIIARGDQNVIDRLFHPDWRDPDAALALLRELTARDLAPHGDAHLAKVRLAVGDRDGFLEVGESVTTPVPGLLWPDPIIAGHLRQLELEDWFLRQSLRRDDADFAPFAKMLKRPMPIDLVEAARRSEHQPTADLARDRCRTARGGELAALWSQALRGGEPWPALFGNHTRLDAEASGYGWRLWLAAPTRELSAHLLRHGSEVTDPALDDTSVAGDTDLLIEVLLSPRLPRAIRVLIERSPTLRGHMVHDLLSGRLDALDTERLAAGYRHPPLREPIRAALREARGLDVLAIVNPASPEDRYFVADAFLGWEDWASLRDYLLTWPFLDVLQYGPRLARHHPPELSALRPALDADRAMIRYARVTRSPRIKPILRCSLAGMTGDDLAVVRWIQKSAKSNPKLCLLAQVIESCLTRRRRSGGDG
ncbi:hypothetical protein ACFWY5_48760 [Nonomuraea sp. NPDC059007]|uniref:hypothetical protein n=1 Tax=Nonomuraea sp. NPDC059007 TaxID=3346692 RepID=UPI0036BC4047